jgi:P27 family predicted phage terminase small subunit
MPVGRPPKPVEQKRRAGNPGKRKLPEPVSGLPAAAGVPATPAGLLAPGKRFWADVWRYGQAWISPGLDSGVVELAARAFDEVHAHRRDVARYGRIIEEPVLHLGEVVAGVVHLKPNPAIKSQRDAERNLERWLVLLGIPPISRAHLGLAKVKVQSKLQELFGRGGAE